jgi:DNA-binding MarR family transcriptional regulator
MLAPALASDIDHTLETATADSIIGYRLRRTQLAVFQRFLAVFEEMALRPAEFSVLTLVADNPGRKQSEIALALGIKRANFVTLVNDLEARGLVERREAGSDRRANALHLSRAGKAFLARARALHDAMERDMVERLGGPAERDALFRLLDRLM